MRITIFAAICLAIFFSILSTRAASAQEANWENWNEWSGPRGKVRTVRRAVVRNHSTKPTKPTNASLPAAQILPHPAGCPRTLFCGCGASIEVFGKSIRALWWAPNWLKFPKAAPGPGMVAANRSHVMVIRQMIGNNLALVYDANSGGGLTRLHVRSLAGFSIHNPKP